MSKSALDWSAGNLSGSSVLQKDLIVDFLLAAVLLGDSLVVFAALSFAFWLRFVSGWIPFYGMDNPRTPYTDYLPLLFFGTAVMILSFVSRGLYDARVTMRLRRVGQIVLSGSGVWLAAYFGLSWGLKFDPPISRLYVIISFLVVILALLIWRRTVHAVVHINRVAALLRQKVLFVGWGHDSERLLRSMLTDPSRPYEFIGCVEAPAGAGSKALPEEVRKLGNYEGLEEMLAKRIADIVVLADPEAEVSEVISMSNRCERHYVSFKVIPSYFQILASSLHLETVSGVPILGLAQLPLNRTVNRVLKRSVDIVGGFVGLMASAPLIAICGAIVYRESPGPIFYRQQRTGRNGRVFEILKIRSMRLNAESAGPQWAKKDDPRRLKIGAFMRKWNIDETPQFWNVIKGEMSLVGPRPERPELIEKFQWNIPHYNARHASKPGMTGWAQVHGLRGNTSLEERIKYDLYYLENWTPFLDFQIMFATFVRQQNAY